MLFGAVTSHTILEEYHCKDSEVEYGVSLKGGKKAGIFRNLGKTKNIQVCLRRNFSLCFSVPDIMKR